MFDAFKRSMEHEFEMSDLGPMKQILRVKVTQSATYIFINQIKYIQEVLEKFGVKNYNPVKTPIVPDSKLVKALLFFFQ